MNDTVGRRRLALLFDADNASAARLEVLMVEVAKYGHLLVKRAYGDWTSPTLHPWKGKLLAHSIHPKQQFAYTKGKNATDSALIIDAMDLMHSKQFDGFCLVSSDSDFTRLAERLREEGLTVYGLGERKTPDSFVAACDVFTYVESLTKPPAQTPGNRAEQKKSVNTNPDNGVQPADQSQPLVRVDSHTDDKAKPDDDTSLLEGIIMSMTSADAWLKLSTLGSTLTETHPELGGRLKRHGKLLHFLQASSTFETQGEHGDFEVRIKNT